MEKILLLAHRFVTRLLLVPMLAYTFLTQTCPACQHRVEKNAPAFFSSEYEKNAQEEATPHKTALITNELPNTEEEANA